MAAAPSTAEPEGATLAARPGGVAAVDQCPTAAAAPAAVRALAAASARPAVEWTSADATSRPAAAVSRSLAAKAADVATAVKADPRVAAARRSRARLEAPAI